VSPAIDHSAFAGGFVAAEGTFVATGTPPTFTFAVRLGAADSATCHSLRDLLGVGCVHMYKRRKPHYDDEVCYSVRALKDLVGVVVPFMDDHLPPSYKRLQFEHWKASLLSYWEQDASRLRCCSLHGCEATQRARGLCRRHYYEAFGK
jgi:hypothetical protein